jgi:phospholipase A-2-activating protein
VTGSQDKKIRLWF